MEKLYCYVDETGQDTRGRFFLVALILTQVQREDLRQRLQAIERRSGKVAQKWTDTTLAQKHAYLQALFHTTAFQGTMFYREFAGRTDYLTCTIEAIAQGITHKAHATYRATVIIDSLGKREGILVGASLRRRGVHIKKVRGIPHRSDEFIRLADAVAGFTRDYQEGAAYARQLYPQATKRAILAPL
jgi:hypothetical protein